MRGRLGTAFSGPDLGVAADRGSHVDSDGRQGKSARLSFPRVWLLAPLALTEGVNELEVAAVAEANGLG